MKKRKFDSDDIDETKDIERELNSEISRICNSPVNAWITPNEWKRVKALGKGEHEFIYFPFELNEDDYLRRLFAIFSEYLTTPIRSMLFKGSPSSDAEDFLALLGAFSSRLLDQSSLSLKEKDSQYPEYDFQKLQSLAELFYRHRSYLFNSRETANKYDITKLFFSAKEFLNCLRDLPSIPHIDASILHAASAALTSIEEQYKSHMVYKDKRFHLFNEVKNSVVPIVEEKQSSHKLNMEPEEGEEIMEESEKGIVLYPPPVPPAVPVSGLPFPNPNNTNLTRLLPSSFPNQQIPSSSYSAQIPTSSYHQPLSSSHQRPRPPSGPLPYYHPSSGIKGIARYRELGYSAKQLKEEGGFSAKQLLLAGFTLEELKEAGFTPYHLKFAGITVSELLKAGFLPIHIKDGNYNIHDFYQERQSFPLSTYHEAGFTAAQFLSLRKYSLQEALDAGYSLSQLHGSRMVEPRDLMKLGFTLSQLREKGFTIKEVIGSKFTLQELREAGYTAAQLKQVGYTLDDLISVQFTVNNLKAAQFSPKELISKGFTLEQLREAGFNAKQLMPVVNSPSELKNIGFSASQLLDTGYSPKDLKEAGYTAMQLKSAKISPEELRKLGYTIAQLKEAAIAGTMLREMGVPASEMREGAYSSAQMRAFGYKPYELIEAGYLIHQLRDGGFSAEEIQQSIEENAAENPNLFFPSF